MVKNKVPSQTNAWRQDLNCTCVYRLIMQNEYCTIIVCMQHLFEPNTMLRLFANSIFCAIHLRIYAQKYYVTSYTVFSGEPLQKLRVDIVHEGLFTLCEYESELFLRCFAVTS